MKCNNAHCWKVHPARAVKMQHYLRRKLRLQKWSGQPPRLIAGADVSFKGGKATGVVVVVTYPRCTIVECIRKTGKVSYPYIPGLLTFREGPILERCFTALQTEPGVIIFDGQGIAHPRRMGLAAHLGVLLNRPTVGCAKTRLFGHHREPGGRRGSFSYLLDAHHRRIGAVVRTRDHVKAVYVSPGHRMDIAGAIHIILLCTGKYRLPEPIRMAHRLGREAL